MTTKQWLMRARNMESRIAALRTTQQQAFERATSSTARPKDVCVMGGGQADRNAAYAIISESVQAQLDRLSSIKAETLDAIGMLDDNVLATLLIEYYVNRRTWEEVAVAINYSYSQTVKNLHPKALRKLEHAIECHRMPQGEYGIMV